MRGRIKQKKLFSGVINIEGLNRFKRRMELTSGKSLREENIKNAKMLINCTFEDDPSHNPYMVFYNTKDKISPRLYDGKYNASYGVVTKFQTEITDPLKLGEIIYDEKYDDYWLCIESYIRGEINYEGKLGKCNKMLRWQDEKCVIHEIPMISRNATQYNNGENKDKVMTIGADQIMTYTELNENTKILNHDKKFFIDNDDETPTAYKLTKIDTVNYSYMGKGYMSLMFTETQHTATDKDLKNGIPDYIDPTTLPLPSVPDANESSILSEIQYKSSTLKIGKPREFIAKFSDDNDNILDDLIPKWTFVCGFDQELLTYDIYDNVIKLNVLDNSLIGESFILRLDSENGLVTQSEIRINIDSYY